MKKVFLQKILVSLGASFLVTLASAKASRLETYTEVVTQNFKIPISQFPLTLKEQDLKFIIENSSEYPLTYCSLESFPSLQFSWGGYTSPIGLLNQLPVAHLELNRPAIDSENVSLIKKNGQLCFNLFFDVFLIEKGEVISGLEKYKQSFIVMLRGVLTNRDNPVSKM